jgi:hypothetical protein
MSHDRTTAAHWAVACWLLAVLSCAFGVYCWVRDPFYQGPMAAQGLGSLFSWLAALAGVGVGLVLGMVGLLLTRRFLLVLGLVNLAVLIAAGASIGTHYDELPEYIGTERWAGMLALLAISTLLSVAMVVVWRRRGAPPKQSAAPDTGRHSG